MPDDQLTQLRDRLEKARALYEKADEGADKIRAFEIISEIEEQIRQLEYRNRLLSGDE